MEMAILTRAGLISQKARSVEKSEPASVAATEPATARVSDTKGTPTGFERLARWWSNNRGNRLTVSRLKQEMMPEATKYFDDSAM